MMGKIILFLGLLVAVVYGSNVDSKIAKTSKTLHSYSQNYQRLNKKMAQTAAAILKQKKQLKVQQEQIAALEKELKEKASSYSFSKKQLQELQKKQQELQKKQQALQDELTFIIAQSVSLSVLLEKNFHTNETSLIELEVLKAKLQQYKKQLAKLNKEYFSIANTIRQIDTQAKHLKQSIDDIDKKKKQLLVMQKKNKKALKKLKLTQASYKKSLQRLLKKQDELKRTLSRLKIIKIDKERRAREAKERKAAFARGSVATKDLPKVKQYGKSYQSIKTKRYKGAKTIAPLRYYTITKKYGTYTDPIYGIKVFNESIAMKPKKPRARVRNVFNGKVIYADKTAVLDNIVIVEHKNGLHTIYANLSQIAPGIKKGKRIKKGYVIGRVDDELIFEVTQRSSHINPIRLFK